MQGFAFSFVVFLLVALLLLCIVLLVASLRKQKIDKENLPKLDRVDLLSGKARTMLKDLEKVGGNLGLEVYPQVGLGSMVRPAADAENADEWNQFLRGIPVDFTLYETGQARVRLVVLRESSSQKARHSLIERVCADVGIPVLKVREYDESGLEKIVAEKAGIKRARKKKGGEAAEDSESQPSPMLSGGVSAEDLQQAQ